MKFEILTFTYATTVWYGGDSSDYGIEAINKRGILEAPVNDKYHPEECVNEMAN